MTQNIRITCDNCRKIKGNETANRDAWQILKNMDLLTAINSKVRLDQDHHFCGFACLRMWALQAEAASPELVSAAEGLHPRGTFTNDKLGLHY